MKKGYVKDLDGNEYLPGDVYKCPLCHGCGKIEVIQQMQNGHMQVCYSPEKLTLNPIFEKTRINCSLCISTGRVDYHTKKTGLREWQRK